MIRFAVEEDLEELARVYADSVKTLGRRCYTPEQVRVWASFSHDREKFRNFIFSVTTFVMVEHGDIAGFCGIGIDGHVASLYVRGEKAGLGIGSRLLRAAIQYGESVGVVHLYAEASELSRPVFERFGFTVCGVENAVRNGVVFRRYEMEKSSPARQLSSAAPA